MVLKIQIPTIYASKKPENRPFQKEVLSSNHRFLGAKCCSIATYVSGESRNRQSSCPRSGGVDIGKLLTGKGSENRLSLCHPPFLRGELLVFGECISVLVVFFPLANYLVVGRFFDT